MERRADARTSWPQTALHVLGAGILILPLIFLTGMLMVAIDVLDGLRNGGGLGDSIGFVLRGLQYAIAAGCSLLLPRMVLKRSHAVVAASIWGTIVSTLYVLIMIVGYLDATADLDFGQWLEVAAGLAGLIGGTILFCKEISPKMDARDR